MTTLSGRRVLIVEDESLVAMLAEDFLIELGAIVIGPATSIDDAIAMIATHEIDAAVLDLNIRGERSDRVADALRLRGIPIVCATGYGEGAAEFASGSTIVAKPYSKENLDHSLQLALRRAGQNRKLIATQGIGQPPRRLLLGGGEGLPLWPR